MAQEINPSGEKIYDPNLGEERDAFPGEVVPPEQEATLQRLMREEKETFRRRYDPIADQLTPEQRDAIAAAEFALAELKRNEYLEAIGQNPAIIIKNILQSLDPNKNRNISNALTTLNQSVERILRFVENKKISDQLKENVSPTINYLRNLAIPDLLTIRINVLNDTDQPNAFQAFKQLGFLPNDSIKTFSDLKSAVVNARNEPDSGKPFANRPGGTLSLEGFLSNKPGLEGVDARVNFENSEYFVPNAVALRGSPEAYARIIDKGQYTPYNQQQSR